MVDLLNIVRSFSFGLFLVLAFFAGAFIFWRKGKEEYYDENQLFDMLISASFWGLIGSRVGFVLVHFPDFDFDVLKWFSVFSYPGYLGLTGLIVGLIVLSSKAHKLKLDAYELCDFAAIVIAFSTVVISIGMFVNGSGFGNATTLPIGLSFPGVFDKHHPVQIYTAIFYLALFTALWKLERIYRTFLWYRENRRTAQTGFIFASFWIGFGLIGLLLSLVSQSSIVIFSFPADPFLYGFSVFLGLGILYVRSGRSIGFKGTSKKKSTVASEDTTVVV